MIGPRLDDDSEDHRKLHSSSAPSVLSQAPILSTPDNYNFDDQNRLRGNSAGVTDKTPESKEKIWRTYEVERTVSEVLAGGWKRVALQFPDNMLGDSGVVVDGILEALRRRESESDETQRLKRGKLSNLKTQDSATGTPNEDAGADVVLNNKTESDRFIRSDSGDLQEKVGRIVSNSTSTDLCDAELKSDLKSTDTVEVTSTPDQDVGLHTEINALSLSATPPSPTQTTNVKGGKIYLYILADTSYGSCCVDEIAAQHVDAEVVVHYGRSCLSPTTRLPVIYVFTTPPLDLDAVVQSFEQTFKTDTRILLMADITYHSHVQAVLERLEKHGYTDIIAPEVEHNPASWIPNRKIGPDVDLKDFSLFHISEPPTALILTLSSRVKDMYIFPTAAASTVSPTPTTVKATTANLIRRRYGLLSSLNTCPIFGILINTLSVANHLDALESIQKLIREAGKKYYTFVVGKVNAAKMANFSEIGGWVVVGCWETSLLENGDFYRPVITPWELDWVLKSEKIRVWNGDWRGDFHGIGKGDMKVEIEVAPEAEAAVHDENNHLSSGRDDETIRPASSDNSSESESEPPEFDLRTCRYVSHSRPMKKATRTHRLSAPEHVKASQALSRKARGDLATINGAVSPGAEFLRSQRTWMGLGSDFQQEGEEENVAAAAAAADVEAGRTGVARGYVGERS